MARILLVEDEAEIRDLLLLTLVGFGHSVVPARHGAEALQLFHCDHFDLLITDLVMPGTEGMEVIAELRRRRPALKIIAISGGGKIGTAADYLHVARRLGAAKVLEKPFSPGLLKETIDQLLSADPAGSA